MPEIISRWIAGAEAMTIGLLTITAWAFQILYLGTIGLSLAEPIRDVLMLINLAILTAGLFATLWLLWVLVSSGSARLKRQHFLVWVPPLLAALLIVVGRIMSSIIPASAGVGIAYSVFGAPLFTLIPLVHLVAERVLRSNKSLERARER